MSEIIDLMSERTKRIASPSPVAARAQERVEQASAALAGILTHYKQAKGDHIKVSLEVFRIVCQDAEMARLFGERQLYVSGLMPPFVKLSKDELDEIAKTRVIPNQPFIAVMGDDGVVFRVDKES